MMVFIKDYLVFIDKLYLKYRKTENSCIFELVIDVDPTATSSGIYAGGPSDYCALSQPKYLLYLIPSVKK